MEFKYFKASEIIGLDLNLVEALDRARGYSEAPFIITSGYRTEKENKKVGGVEKSAHRTGQAVDIRCFTARYRFKIVRALLLAGFDRIGIRSDHIHVDISTELTPNVLFLEKEVT